MILIEITEKEYPGLLLNINAQRGQTRHLSRLTAPWRALGKRKALAHRRKALETPVVIWVHFRFPNNRRRDTGNLYPTAKALVDGIVDAKILPDDCDGVVSGPHLEREYPNGPGRIVIAIQSEKDEALQRNQEALATALTHLQGSD